VQPLSSVAIVATPELLAIDGFALRDHIVRVPLGGI